VTMVARIISFARTGPEYSVIVPSSVFSGTQNSRGPLDRRGTPVMPWTVLVSSSRHLKRSRWRLCE
jgi:hypothetical protein